MSTGAYIKRAGLKVTPQRIMVYELMMELGHSTIEDIITRVRQEHPEITVSTVYRIVESFCEAGILSKIANPDGKTLFDITPTEHPHLFVNGEVVDCPNLEWSEMLKKCLEENSLFQNLMIEKISINIIATKKL